MNETEDWKTTDGRLEVRGRAGKSGRAAVSSFLRWLDGFQDARARPRVPMDDLADKAEEP